MKKLIYFTLGNNVDYINLAKLCINSLEKVNYDGDFLFITNHQEMVMNNINFKNKVFFMEVNDDTLHSSSSNKLKLYEFENIEKYDKIIFSDLDIIFVNNPDLIFNQIIGDKFYVSNEDSLMSEEWWGARILTDEEKEKIINLRIMGINAGIFAFNKNMVKELYKIDKFLSENINLSNECLEQPFFNTYLYRNSLYNNTLNEYVSHKGYHLDEYDGVAVHFAGGPGNYQIKYDKMILFYKKNIENDKI